jgi:hydrogenase expression/formation protein HypC
MCLTRPAEVLEVDGATAWVEWQGTAVAVDVSLVGPVAAGELLLVHAGLALEKITRDEAADLAAVLAVWEAGGAPAAPEPGAVGERKNDA